MIFPLDGPLGVNAPGAFWYDSWLYPIEWVVAWVMYLIHSGLGFLGLTGTLDGFAWVLSIIGLTIIVRIVIMPLFFKQIKASRGIQLMQPEIKKLQDKYRGRKDPESRQQMSAEMMALYKKHGTNPMSSCWPIFLQMPIFFSLFSVLRSMRTLAVPGHDWAGHATLGPIDQKVAQAFEGSTFLGSKLSDSLLPWDATGMATKVLCIVLILAMVTTQFLTMRQLTMKNMPAAVTDDDNPMMKSQRMMMYTMPLIMGFTGIYFQVGVLIYWLTTNLWTTGQQAWTITRMPAPGSEAHDKLMRRNKEKYGEYRDEITPGYEQKIAEARSAGDDDKAESLQRELLEKLRSRKIKLGLETAKPKTSVSADSDSSDSSIEGGDRFQPQKLTRAERKALRDRTKAGGTKQDEASSPQDRAAQREARRQKVRQQTQAKNKRKKKKK